MCVSLKINHHSCTPLLVSNGFPKWTISRVSTPFHFPKSNNRLLSPPLCCSISSHNNNVDAGNCSPINQGSEEKSESSWRKSLSSKEVLEKLRRYGISGILSYGLLNTAYYLTTFLVVWFYVAPAPGRMGYVAAVERFLKVMAMVWAGSQVTKIIRAGGALALAPFVDRGLSWFTEKFNFKTQGKASMVIVGFCFGLALLLFFAVTLLSA